MRALSLVGRGVSSQGEGALVLVVVLGILASAPKQCEAEDALMKEEYLDQLDLDPVDVSQYEEELDREERAAAVTFAPGKQGRCYDCSGDEDCLKADADKPANPFLPREKECSEKYGREGKTVPTCYAIKYKWSPRTEDTRKKNPNTATAAAKGCVMAKCLEEAFRITSLPIGSSKTDTCVKGKYTLGAFSCFQTCIIHYRLSESPFDAVRSGCNWHPLGNPGFEPVVPDEYGEMGQMYYYDVTICACKGDLCNDNVVAAMKSPKDIEAGGPALESLGLASMVTSSLIVTFASLQSTR